MSDKQSQLESRELTCIICPNGCAMRAEIEDGEVIAVEGNGCMRGYAYAQREVISPTRTFTSTMKIEGGTEKLVSVKSKKEIPKEMMLACADALKGMAAAAPVSIGDILVKNIAKTGVDIIATVNVSKMQ